MEKEQVEIMMQFRASDIKLFSFTIISHYIFALMMRWTLESGGYLDSKMDT